VLVNKFAYGLRLPFTGTLLIPIGAPKRGDVVVFRFPDDRARTTSSA
jgi:signal peptidase I